MPSSEARCCDKFCARRWGFLTRLMVRGSGFFSEAIGSDWDLGKGGVLFSPMGGNGGKLVWGFENNGTQKPGRREGFGDDDDDGFDWVLMWVGSIEKEEELPVSL
ncbi:hypothetical protein MRB53_006644 [Persea americana]|uniref:Uncharacterized protein n=1 Tax=Persea americana TaxID=3435 RepID=A0ACC2MGZ9_PERAE|nr:hypothetical protein MRB53_006644 [Persea americana]